MRRTRPVFWALVLTEVLAIGALGLVIFYTSKGLASVYKINQADVIAAAGSFLYMYEPAPSTVGFGNNQPSWLAKIPDNTINKDSLNERYDYVLEKPSSAYRIITLGDSHTFGVYVENSENYSEVLEDMLNERLACTNIKKFEVLNLGVPGYDVQYMVERFNIRGAKYDPDLVTLLLQDRQFEQDRERLKPLLARASEGKNVADTEVWTEVWTSAAAALSQETAKEDIEAYELSALPRLATMHNGSILMIPFGLSDKLRTAVASFASKAGDAHMTDPVPDLWAACGSLPDGHPNPVGHRIIAELLFDYLTQTNLIDCKT